MTWFDPKIYNVKNLKPEDRNQVEFWFEEFETMIDCCAEMVSSITGIDAIDNIIDEVIENFTYELKDYAVAHKREICASIIDNYEEDYEIKEYEEYE